VRDPPIHMYLTRGELSEGRTSWDSLALTLSCGYHRSAVLPLRGRPGSELFLKLGDSNNRLEWTLRRVVINSSGDYGGVSRLVLGKARLPDATPACKQYAGRGVTDRA